MGKLSDRNFGSEPSGQGDGMDPHGPSDSDLFKLYAPSFEPEGLHVPLNGYKMRHGERIWTPSGPIERYLWNTFVKKLQGKLQDDSPDLRLQPDLSLAGPIRFHHLRLNKGRGGSSVVSALVEMRNPQEDYLIAFDDFRQSPRWQVVPSSAGGAFLECRLEFSWERGIPESLEPSSTILLTTEAFQLAVIDIEENLDELINLYFATDSGNYLLDIIVGEAYELIGSSYRNPYDFLARVRIHLIENDHFVAPERKEIVCLAEVPNFSSETWKKSRLERCIVRLRYNDGDEAYSRHLAGLISLSSERLG